MTCNEKIVDKVVELINIGHERAHSEKNAIQNIVNTSSTTFLELDNLLKIAKMEERTANRVEILANGRIQRTLRRHIDQDAVAAAKQRVN